MAEALEYRGRAVECERLAQDTLHPESREILLKIAARWRSRAEAAEARPQPSGLEQSSRP